MLTPSLSVTLNAVKSLPGPFRTDPAKHLSDETLRFAQGDREETQGDEVVV